jgi:HSP20 family protein
LSKEIHGKNKCNQPKTPINGKNQFHKFKGDTMQLVKCRPQHNMTRVADNTPRLFDTFLDDFFTPFTNTVSPRIFNENLNLKVDIYEKDDTVIIEAELPGVEKEDLFVDTKGKLVTLGGERKSDEKITDVNSYRRERNYGKFERSFNLPFEINTEKVTATFNNGILKLEIPKPEEETTSKVTIQ